MTNAVKTIGFATAVLWAATSTFAAHIVVGPTLNAPQQSGGSGTVATTNDGTITPGPASLDVNGLQYGLTTNSSVSSQWSTTFNNIFISTPGVYALRISGFTDATSDLAGGTANFVVRGFTNNTAFPEIDFFETVHPTSTSRWVRWDLISKPFALAVGGIGIAEQSTVSWGYPIGTQSATISFASDYTVSLAAVPEPSTIAMTSIAAMAGLSYARRRRKRSDS